MQRLVGTRLADQIRQFTRKDKPWHYMVSLGSPTSATTGVCLVPESLLTYKTSDNLSRITHPCFGDGDSAYLAQPPRQFSAGFHQIFPIIVQLGLMRSGELICIENPEVHLHPSLQLEFTKTLIDHVASGRRLFIETHSDLVIRRVIRRVIRAILDGGLGESNVQINCY